MELFLWLGRNKMRPEYSFSSLYRTGGGAGNRGGRRSDQSHGPETIAILPSSSQAGIIYYSKEKYFRHVQQAAAVGLEKFNNDPVLRFFKAYGVLGEGEDPSVLPPDLGPSLSSNAPTPPGWLLLPQSCFPGNSLTQSG